MTQTPTVRTPGTVASVNSGTSLSVAYPSSSQFVANDVLLLFACDGTPATIGNPSGWTLLDSNTSVSDVFGGVWWKQAVGNETGSVALSWTGSGPGIGVIVPVGLVAGSGQPHAHGNAINSSASATSVAPPTLSPVPAATDMVVRVYMPSTNSAAAITSISAPGGTWTTVVNTQTSAGSSAFNAGIVVAWKVSGTDSQTCTITPSGSTSGWFLGSVALIGAPNTTSPPVLNQSVKRAAYY